MLFKKMDAKLKKSIVKDWVSTGERYLDLADRHEVTIHIVKMCIEEYLVNTRAEKTV